jgi:hypothetical protein
LEQRMISGSSYHQIEMKKKSAASKGAAHNPSPPLETSKKN